ncbi:hypothetical protein FB451DRAFT_1567556 [Mycena latifolia]|nr:hypothetical protein FB451DRAFT_1567556 [Mycena latifolia]
MTLTESHEPIPSVHLPALRDFTGPEIVARAVVPGSTVSAPTVIWDLSIYETSAPMSAGRFALVPAPLTKLTNIMSCWAALDPPHPRERLPPLERVPPQKATFEIEWNTVHGLQDRCLTLHSCTLFSHVDWACLPSAPPMWFPISAVDMECAESVNLWFQSTRLRHAVVLRAPTIESAAIYCGAEDVTQGLQAIFLPTITTNIVLGPSKYFHGGSSTSSSQVRRSRSNGCGAQDELAPTVVPLETEYFPSAMAESLDLKKGGDWRVGASGNPLGTQQRYCAVHSPSSSGRDGYVFLTTAVSFTRTSSSLKMSPQPPPRRLRCTVRKTIGYESPPPSTPSRPALPPTSPSRAARTPHRPLPPPLRSPTVSSSAAAASPATPVAPARPVRRHTLRRLGSVERHFGLDAAASTSSPASLPAGRDAPRSPTTGDVTSDTGGGGGGTMSMSEYLRTLTAPAAQARAAHSAP